MDELTLEDGTVVRLGCVQPAELRFAAAPAWDEANPVLSEAECLDTERNKPFLSPVKYQKNNNCTNAALAGLGEAIERASGVEDVPRLSMTMQYALHNDGRDAGAMCRDLADDYRKRGLCREALWGDDKIFLPRGGLPQAVLDDAKNHVALEIYQCLDWSHVRSALARDFFVYHGFVLGNAFFQTRKDGKVPAFDGSFRNGHAMFSWGLTRRFGDLRACARNSWDVSFGDNGDCYVPAGYFWGQSGNYVNLDAYAVRAVRRVDRLPVAA
jgi:hypothetical protein